MNINFLSKVGKRALVPGMALGLQALLYPSIALGQLSTPTIIPVTGMIGRCSFVQGTMHFDCIPLYVAYLIGFVFSLVGTICLIQIIISGYQVAIAAAFAGDRAGALSRLRYALIGFAVCVLAYFIVNLIVDAITPA